MATDLDTHDRAILVELQKDSRVSVSALAEASGLSTASVQRRVKRLRDTGVILGEVAVLNQKALGYDLTFIVQVELEREKVSHVREFRTRLEREARVQQVYYVTGEADFILICLARDMKDFEELTQRLFFDNANVRKFRSSVVMGQSNVGLSVPLDEH